MKKKKFLFRIRFKFEESGKWIPSAWFTYDEKEAYLEAEKFREDPLTEVYCYDLSSAILV